MHQSNLPGRFDEALGTDQTMTLAGTKSSAAAKFIESVNRTPKLNQPADIARFESDLWGAFEKRITEGWVRCYSHSRWGDAVILASGKISANYGSPFLALAIEKDFERHRNRSPAAFNMEFTVVPLLRDAYRLSGEFMSGVIQGYELAHYPFISSCSALGWHEKNVPIDCRAGWLFGQHLRCGVDSLIPEG